MLSLPGVLFGEEAQSGLYPGLADAVFTSSSLPPGKRSINFEKFWKRAEVGILGISVVGGAAVGCGTCHSVSSARCAPAPRGPRAGAAVSMAAAILSSQ